MNVRRTHLAMRYMWAAWLNILRWVGLAIFLVFLGIALITSDPKWFVAVGISGGAFLLALLFFLLEAAGVRCLGCGGALLRVTRCTKHKTARKILGSYTLHTTLVLAIYAKSIKCPYCGMRYRISRISNKAHREAEENAQESERARAKEREEEARREAEAKNVPYY